MEAILASISDMSALILLASPETRADGGRARTSDKLSTLLPRDGGKLKRPGSPCLTVTFGEKKILQKPLHNMHQYVSTTRIFKVTRFKIYNTINGNNLTNNDIYR